MLKHISMSLETLIGVINQKNHRPYKPSSFKSPAHERAILLIRCWIEDVNTISKIFFLKKKKGTGLNGIIQFLEQQYVI